MRVLIVEDERLISLVLSRIMSELGHEVLACLPSGESVLSFLSGQTVPDFILMDIRLEGSMDGIETVARIKEKWSIPFAYASAYTDTATRTRAESTRPLEILRKPIRKDELRSLLDKVADLKAG